MDWASVMSKRNDPAIWEATVTNHGFVPEPSLITIVNPAYVGWWDTPAKTAALETFNSTVDPAARAAAWGKMQTLLMEEVPTIIIGEFFVPRAVAKNVTGDLTVAADAVLEHRQEMRSHAVGGATLPAAARRFPPRASRRADAPARPADETVPDAPGSLGASSPASPR